MTPYIRGLKLPAPGPFQARPLPLIGPHRCQSLYWNQARPGLWLGPQGSPWAVFFFFLLKEERFDHSNVFIERGKV